ncbi:MAG: (Fe-S)-binding protein [Proteobacteria bacterium]|nr:(Fe-S)-binding protein [Pseudomonadota bacterium]
MAFERLKELEDEMHKCFRCNLCKMVPLPVVGNPDYFDACPANREFGFHCYSGSGKQIMSLALVQGRIEADDKLSGIAYACTTCGSCDVACKFNMEAERQQVNMALREHMVDEGLDLDVHLETLDNLKRYGHPDGKLATAPGEWAEGLGLKVLPGEKAEVLLFAGCLQRNDDRSAETVRKLAKLLLHAGVDFGILGDAELSCGLQAYWTGYRDFFSETAERTNSVLNASGVKTIVTVSGSCFGALKSKYPEYAEAPRARVLHASEFLWSLIKERKIALPRSVKRKVTYHDPCYLGRQSEPPIVWQGEKKTALGCVTYNDPIRPINRGTKGVFDPPREILKAIGGLKFIEMHRIREYAFCCGGGGGAPKAYPDLAESAARHRFEEAAEVGAECMATACHQCRINLAGVGESAGKEAAMPVVDVIDIVYEAAKIK